MKFLNIFLITLFFAFNVFGQKTTEDIKKQLKTFKDTNDRRYQIKYDKFENKTKVLYMGDALNSGVNFAFSGTSIQLFTLFGFEGDKLEKSIDDFALLIRATGKSFQFSRNQHLYLIADDERFDLGEGDRDSDIARQFLFGGLQTVEVLGFKVSRSQLEKFSNAKKIEMKVGERVFELKDSSKKGFTNMLLLGKVE